MDDIAGFAAGMEADRLFERKGSVTFPTFTRRLSRFTKTTFRYQEFAVHTPCFGTDHYVRPVSWLTGTNTQSQVPDGKGLDQCRKSALGSGNEPGGKFDTTDATAQTYAVTVGGALAGLGAKLSVRNGFDRATRIHYSFKKRKATRGYYLCGPGGEQSAADAKRVLAGLDSTS